MWDKGVLLHRQQRHPLISHRLLSCRETVYMSIYLGLEAEDCDSDTNYCCYSHGDEHGFCVIITVKDDMYIHLYIYTACHWCCASRSNVLYLGGWWGRGFWCITWNEANDKPWNCSRHIRQGQSLQDETWKQHAINVRAPFVWSFRDFLFYQLPCFCWFSSLFLK